MQSDDLIEQAKHCFACGEDNPIGLKIAFAFDGDRCRAEFTPGEDHVGYANTIHGGIVFSCLDDVMGNILYYQKRKAHTAKCDIRYRQPLRIGQTIVLSGWIEQERGRLVQLQSEARRKDDNSLVASATASFILA